VGGGGRRRPVARVKTQKKPFQKGGRLRLETICTKGTLLVWEGGGCGTPERRVLKRGKEGEEGSCLGKKKGPSCKKRNPARVETMATIVGGKSSSEGKFPSFYLEEKKRHREEYYG